MPFCWLPHLHSVFIHTFLYLLSQTLPEQKPGKWVELNKTVTECVQ